MSTHNCTDLGLCQSRTPPCAGCIHDRPFAPGVVDGYPKPTVIPAIPTWLAVWICLLLIIFLTGFTAGDRKSVV